jgi:hypothetical protein
MVGDRSTLADEAGLRERERERQVWPDARPGCLARRGVDPRGNIERKHRPLDRPRPLDESRRPVPRRTTEAVAEQRVDHQCRRWRHTLAGHARVRVFENLQLLCRHAREVRPVPVEHDCRRHIPVCEMTRTDQSATAVATTAREHDHRVVAVRRSLVERLPGERPSGVFHHPGQCQADLLGCDTVDRAHLGRGHRRYRHTVGRLERVGLHQTTPAPTTTPSTPP